MPSSIQKQYFRRVIIIFMISLAIATIGVFLGTVVPSQYFLPIKIIEVIMLIIAFFLRRKKGISYFFLFLFTFISGLSIYPILYQYVSSIGMQTILMTLIATTIIFIFIASYATITNKDFSFLGGILSIALLAFIIMAIIRIFWPLDDTSLLIYSFIGVLIFSGYILYDFNRLKRYGIKKSQIPTYTLNLYLDFINLFLNLLRLIGLLKDRK
ncbi:Bax inhibitor-1/YccA family protein [Cytobacillus kochii]|uniref:Bax inhibitor-1/YccA family protein n=1 Tax=Cytobacillus kochii TaxID=859143 RepID=UPI001CD6B646|nr:Bax inhibitor-1/YccA family protein [Cytobacillus kochii]MCA1024965.1 Bax inhibitor-1/YccA family protein [Cytobacillus kochii]